jgi:hypothetical protein
MGQQPVDKFLGCKRDALDMQVNFRWSASQLATGISIGEIYDDSGQS